MPELTKILTQEDLNRRSAMPRLDLSEYLSLIDAVGRQQGVGAELTLAEGESQRTEKRRLSTAAKVRGLQPTWRLSRPGQLRFVINEPGRPVPGSRPRRPSAPEPQPAAKGRRRKAS